MASAPRSGSVRQASVHRDRLLGRTRAISLGIAAGALAACLGLAAEFAQALPGHARPAAASYGSRRPGPAKASRPGSTGRRHHHPGRKRPNRPLSPPSQPPASTQAPPQTTSGGS